MSTDLTCNTLAACSWERAQLLEMVDSLVTHVPIDHPLFGLKERRKVGHNTMVKAFVEKTAFQNGLSMNTYFNRAPGRMSWAAGFCHLLERKWCCDAKKENQHCENPKTKPFSHRKPLNQIDSEWQYFKHVFVIDQNSCISCVELVWQYDTAE